MPDAASNPPSAPKPRSGSIIYAGLLLIALAIVVLYTSRAAFSSPLALVVVAAIGLAALLLQLRSRKNSADVRAPLWLNILGLLFAIGSVLFDIAHINGAFMLVAALGAVGCFAISGMIVLRGLRRKPNVSDSQN